MALGVLTSPDLRLCEHTADLVGNRQPRASVIKVCCSAAEGMLSAA